MQFFNIAVTAALALCVSCTPTATPAEDCLTQTQAESIVDQFIFILENSNSTKLAPAARKLLAKDFVDFSDSVNFIAGFPLGQETFSSRKEYIQVSNTQPPFPSAKTLDLFHTCNKVVWRFNATVVPEPSLEVLGISIFTVDKPSTGRVNRIDGELNSGAFLANLGNPQCKSSSS